MTVTFANRTALVAVNGKDGNELYDYDKKRRLSNDL